MLLCLTGAGAADAQRMADEGLAVSVDGPGTISYAGIACRDDGGDCVELYADGATVILTAWPDPGATFTGWGGDCSAATETTCTLTMSSAKAVTATFAPGSVPSAPKAPTAQFDRASTQATASPKDAGTFTRPSSSRATFAAHSLGRPLVARTSGGCAVILRFFTSHPGRGLVRLSLKGRFVGAFTFSPPRGGVLVGPFKIARPGVYRFLLTLRDRRGAVAHLTWNLVV